MEENSILMCPRRFLFPARLEDWMFISFYDCSPRVLPYKRRPLPCQVGISCTVHSKWCRTICRIFKLLNIICVQEIKEGKYISKTSTFHAGNKWRLRKCFSLYHVRSAIVLTSRVMIWKTSGVSAPYVTCRTPWERAWRCCWILRQLRLAATQFPCLICNWKIGLSSCSFHPHLLTKLNFARSQSRQQVFGHTN